MGTGPHDTYAFALEIERTDREDGQYDHDQGSRRLGDEPSQSEERGERERADHDCQALPVSDVAQGVDEDLNRVAGRLLDADELRELAHGDVEAQADDEAVEHRLGEEPCDEAHAGNAEKHVHDSDEERQHGAQRDEVGRSVAR